LSFIRTGQWSVPLNKRIPEMIKSSVSMLTSGGGKTLEAKIADLWFYEFTAAESNAEVEL